MHPSLGLRSKSRVWAHEDSEPSGTTHGCLGLTYGLDGESRGFTAPALLCELGLSIGTI
jgi:hypothetical protein